MVFITTQDKEEDYQISGPCVAPFQLESALATTQLQHLSSIRIKSKASIIRLTGLICVIGIASREIETIEQLIDGGMNVACINFCRGPKKLHSEVLNNIRAAVEKVNEKTESNCSFCTAVMTRGSLITTTFRGYPTEIILEEGDFVELTGDADWAIISESKLNIIQVTYPNIQEVVKLNTKLTIGKNEVELICVNFEERSIVCFVTKGGSVKGGEKVHIPELIIDLPSLSEADQAALIFAIENKINVVFAGQVRTAKVVEEIRDFLGSEGNHILVVSQIQTVESITNIDEIIAVSDGIVICREDLRTEISESEIVIAQKSIMAKCNSAGKPVICKTHLFHSMIKSPRPTNAEVCDVANAVLDGADCIMLDHETTIGNFPVLCVQKASQICKQAESAVWQKQLVNDLSNKIVPPIFAINAVTNAAVQISLQTLASAIVVLSASLKSACSLTQYKPKCPIIVVTRNAQKAKQAHLFRGLLPLLYKEGRATDWNKDVDLRIHFGINFGRRKKFIRAGDPVVILHSSVQGIGFTDKMRIFYVSKTLTHGDQCTC